MKELLLSLLAILALGCKKAGDYNNKSSSRPKTDDKIVLIFGERDYSKDTIWFKGGGYSPTAFPITFTDTEGINENVLAPDNITKPDTLIVKSEDDIILEHNYHYYFRSIYKFKLGDTISFNYKDGVPYCEVLNRKVLFNDLNFLTDLNLKAERPISREEFYLNNKRFRTDTEKENYSHLRKGIELEKMTSIDSMINGSLISPSAGFLLKEYLQFLNPQLFIRNYDLELSRDSLLGMSSYRTFLKNYSLYKYKVSSIRNSKQETLLNYKQLFDSIVDNDSLYSKRTKKFILFESIKNIANDFSQKDFEIYSHKFENEVKDSSLINNIKNNYMMDLSILKSNTKDVYLVDSQKRKRTLKEIKTELNGKVVYVDFWASWCAPCREVMDDSKILRELYGDKKVVLIYISIDKEYDSWQKAVNEEELELYKYSFLAVNYPKSDFYKNLKLKTIPRYLLYDKNGKMIYPNAPGPNSKEIKKLFDGYLNKKRN